MLHESVRNLLNQQVNKEFYSAYLYLDFSNNNATRFFLDDMNVTVAGTDYDVSTCKPDNGYWTEADMNEILAEAEQYGVQVIPTLDSPGHIGGVYSINNSWFYRASATDYDAKVGKITLDLSNEDAYVQLLTGGTAGSETGEQG